VTAAFTYGASQGWRGISPAEDFVLALTPATTTSGAGSAATLRDANIQNVSASTIDSVFTVGLADSPVAAGLVAITNLTPGVATFTDGAPATWVSNGTAMVQATHPQLGTKIVSFPVSRALSTSGQKFTGYIPGSITSDLYNLVDNITSTATATTTNTPIFSSGNTRNASLWCGSVVDLTAITREAGANFCNIPLIGPHHALTAAHVGAPVGRTFVWCDNAGNAYAGTVRATATVPGTDIAVLYINDATSGEMAAYNAAGYGPAVSLGLSAASPAFTSTASIKPMALLPGTAWQQNTGTESAPSPTCAMPLDPGVLGLVNAHAMPMFHTTRLNRVGTWDIVGAPASTPYVGGVIYPTEFSWLPSAETDENQFTQGAIVGGTASGDISFTAIPASTTLATANSTLGAKYPILLGTTHGFNPIWKSPWVASSIAGITTAMQSTAQAAGDSGYASYAPTVVSLTGYSTY